MSENVMETGWVARIKNPESIEDRDDFSERLYDDFPYKSPIGYSINYAGTMFYSRKRGGEYYVPLLIGDKSVENFVNSSIKDGGKEKLIEVAARYGIELEEPEPYMNYWYNGTDSPLDLEK